MEQELKRLKFNRLINENYFSPDQPSETLLRKAQALPADFCEAVVSRSSHPIHTKAGLSNGIHLPSIVRIKQ